MNRSTVVLIIFVLIVGAIIGLSQFLTSQPPVTITIAVDPLADAWVRSAAERFNATNPLVNNGTTRITIQISTEDDLDIWTGRVSWNGDNHPDGWLATTSQSIEFAPSNTAFQIVEDSVARSPLVWGGFSDRVTVLDDISGFDWDAFTEVAEAARWDAVGGEANWGFVKFAFNRPASSMNGVAALMTGIADYADDPVVTRQTITGSAFGAWLQAVIDSVPNFQTLGADPAATLVSRGRTIMDVAILPEVQWMTNIDRLASLSDPLVFNYPAYQALLDFPLAAWVDDDTSNVNRQAVEAFGAFLLQDDSQTLALTYGLRPADREPTDTARNFQQATQYGIQLSPDYGTPVVWPSRSDIETLIRRVG